MRNNITICVRHANGKEYLHQQTFGMTLADVQKACDILNKTADGVTYFPNIQQELY